MSAVRRWIRKQIACYGAAVAIIVEQLNSAPSSTLNESPNPLMRIRDRKDPASSWHPDELVTGRSGRAYVLVWDRPEFPDRDGSALLN